MPGPGRAFEPELPERTEAEANAAKAKGADAALLNEVSAARRSAIAASVLATPPPRSRQDLLESAVAANARGDAAAAAGDYTTAADEYASAAQLIEVAKGR